MLVDDLPPGLHPKRAVDHRIELNSGDHKPPHRPSFWRSPAKLDEAKRQVAEYLDKGYIQP